jgi:TolA-binding protein
VMAAESKCQIAYLLFDKKDYKKAKKTVFELADNYSAYEYWFAKGYLLLADIYLIEKDGFQAKATLQSIIENYDGNDEIKPSAVDKMKTIIAAEEKEKLKQVPPTDREVQPSNGN